MKKKKEVTPMWTTVVDPGEYDYVGDFESMVNISNKKEQCYCDMDVGKVWGLVLAYKKLRSQIKEQDASTNKQNTPLPFNGVSDNHCPRCGYYLKAGRE